MLDNKRTLETTQNAIFQNGNKLKEICQECYSEHKRITPLLNPLDCLHNHVQYICGTCGRYICINTDEKRGIQRWHFPFKSLDIAKLYLRTADYTVKKSCVIYEIKSVTGRVSYKIFVDIEALLLYLKQNTNKRCLTMVPLFIKDDYREYPDTEVEKLTSKKIEVYLSER